MARRWIILMGLAAGCAPATPYDEASARLDEVAEKARQVGLPMNADEVAAPAIPDEENAALALLPRLEQWRTQRSEILESQEDEPARAAALKALDEPVLDFAQRQLARPGWRIERDYETNSFARLPDMDLADGLTRALGDRALMRTAQGRPQAARADLMAMLQLAQKYSGERNTIGSLYSRNLTFRAARTALRMAEAAPDDPDEMRRAAAMLASEAFDVDPRLALRSEIAIGIDLGRNHSVYGGIDLLAQCSREKAEECEKPARGRLSQEGLPLNPKARAFLTRWLEFWIQVMDGDPAPIEMRRRYRQEHDRLKEEPGELAEMAVYFLPEVAMISLPSLQIRLHLAMAAAVLNAVALQRETGSWPKNPADGLVNPANGKAVEWAVEGGRITLWTDGYEGENTGRSFERSAQGDRTLRVVWPVPEP